MMRQHIADVKPTQFTQQLQHLFGARITKIGEIDMAGFSDNEHGEIVIEYMHDGSETVYRAVFGVCESGPFLAWSGFAGEMNYDEILFDGIGSFIERNADAIYRVGTDMYGLPDFDVENWEQGFKIIRRDGGDTLEIRANDTGFFPLEIRRMLGAEEKDWWGILDKLSFYISGRLPEYEYRQGEASNFPQGEVYYRILKGTVTSRALIIPMRWFDEMKGRGDLVTEEMFPTYEAATEWVAENVKSPD